MSNVQMRPDIMLVTGRYFDFMVPEQCDFDIVDIAHALANLCRFTGHTRRFYSVAQHSILASHCVPRSLAKEALLHDAPEAFIGDVSRPLKQLLPQYKEIERRVEAVVRLKFQLPEHESPMVKHADLVMLATEKRDLMPTTGDQLHLIADIEPLRMRIEPMPPEMAYLAFMARYSEVCDPRFLDGIDAEYSHE